MALIGIDLGTTNSLVSVWKDGRVEIIKNSLGHTMTPSVVSLEEGGGVLVGEIAKQRRISHPNHTAFEFKRSMGTRKEYILAHRKYYSEDLSAFLLKKMIEDTQDMLDIEVTQAVISVPAYFDDNQREATKRAAKIAGIEVKRLVNEPSAAIIYHQWKSKNTGCEGNYLVIDFGGGTLDVSVVDCFENIIEIISISGDNKLGGKDFDRYIAEDFCKRFDLKFSRLDKQTKENLLWIAENVKRNLSREDCVIMRATIDSIEYEAEYTTDELLKVTSGLLLKMQSVINEALRGARIEPGQLVDIVLVGGTCKMPLIQKYLSALFHRDVVADAECERLVALGVGVLTGIIGRDEHVSDIVMTDVCPFSLGTGTYHSKVDSELSMSVIIPKNSILPISKSSIYCGLEKFQKQIKFEIFQGEKLRAKDNLSLGCLFVDVTPNENGDTAAQVTFCYDINGVLQVYAQDLNGDNKAEMVVVSKTFQLSEQEIEKKKIDIKKEQRFEKNKEENRHILAWGHRLYAQANPEYKDYIAGIVNDFAYYVERNDVAMVQRKKKGVIEQLLALEKVVNRDYFENEDVITELLDED